ncbi:hypothetical protein Golob_027798, partial [Gossypium lobatum]|nr:hypothetical protein [Gossypium lobatum]
GIEVNVTPRIICDYYDTPFYDQDFIDEIELEYFRDIDMDNIINYLTERMGGWKYRPVMALCEREGVLMASTEQLLKLSRSIIADTLLQHISSLNICTFDGGPIVSTIAKDCDVYDEFDDYSSWDEEREMSAWYDDEMYCKEASIWANKVTTNQESYDRESNMPEYSIK